MHRFVYLSRSDRRLVLEAALLLSAARLGLWLLPFQVVSRLLDKATRPRVAVAAPALRIAWAIGAAARYIPAATCLAQALAGRAMLIRHGHAAQLRIGVARAPVSQSAEPRRRADEAKRRRTWRLRVFVSAPPQPIAACMTNDRILAHAWVECDGAVLVGGLADLARYTLLPTRGETHR